MTHHVTRRIVRAAASLAVALSLVAAAPAPVRFEKVPVVGVTTLLFHQISDSPVVSAAGEDNVKKPWIGPAAFDALLTELERRGYTFVPLRRALAYLNGTDVADFPKKPLVLTFDDGYADADRAGTPILRKHHATATMFFEGRLTDVRPDRLTVAQLRGMLASGAWELECHGWAGHSNVAIDATGKLSPYWYANLAWLPAANRLETLDEFETRVRADLHRFRTTFEPQLGVKLDVFAYPSGEFGQNGALVAGGDPRTLLEAGHSNAPGLTARLLSALRAEGFVNAEAVSIPGDVAPASRANDPYAFPRLGVGADFTVASLDALETDGFPLPEIVDGHFSDPGPIAADGNGFLVAASAAPVLYRLDAFGRVVARWNVPALLDDRAGHPALISGIAPTGATVTIVQQAGTWPGATPRITRLRLAAGGAIVVDRTALPSSLNWLVGIAPVGDHLVGLTDNGIVVDVPSGAVRGTIPTTPPGGSRNDRFAGPLAVGTNLAVYDRVAHQLVVLDGTAPAQIVPLGGDLRNFAATPDGLIAVDWADRRHVAERWRTVTP